MMNQRNLNFTFCSVTVLILAACGSPKAATTPSASSNPACSIIAKPGSANPSFVAAPGLFTVSPIDVSNISGIQPLGNMIAPGHIYPSDHIYLNMIDSTANAHSVYAPAAGTVVYIYSPDSNTTDYRIIVSVDRSFQYFVDHVKPSVGLGVGSSVTAGQNIATNSGDSRAIDLGVYNFNQTSYPGILDACIQQAEKYTDAPLKYFTSNLSASLYHLVTTTNANKDGTIGFDIAGKLVGNWLLKGAANAFASTTNQLVLGYDTKTENTMHIAIGGNAMPVGDYEVSLSDPDFSTVSPASGVVTYHVSGENGAPSGALVVQMTDASTIKIEFFSGVSSGSLDGNAFTYTR